VPSGQPSRSGEPSENSLAGRPPFRAGAEKIRDQSYERARLFLMGKMSRSSNRHHLRVRQAVDELASVRTGNDMILLAHKDQDRRVDARKPLRQSSLSAGTAGKRDQVPPALDEVSKDF